MNCNQEPFLNSRRKFISKAVASGALLPVAGTARSVSAQSTRINSGNGWSIRDFGASGSGTHLDTTSIQAAIDACSQAGGGIVRFPPGTYLSGTIFLKSKVCLLIEVGATLLGSASLADYPSIRPKMLRSYTDNYVQNSLIYAEEVDQVAIMGGGTIDGQGAMFHGKYLERPYLLRFVSCSSVDVSGIRLLNSPMWVQHYLECRNVHLHNLFVRSVCNENNDGIDLDACEKVRVSDCDIQSSDDAVVLKSTTGKPCQDVTISNCVISSGCNAIKMGTESVGGFRNINISNCAVYDTELSGIALETVDGGVLENVNVSNITMSNVRSAIFLRLGDRGRSISEGEPRRPVGTFRNVTLTNIFADGADKIGCAISGLPDHALENVTLQNIRVEYQGGVTGDDVRREVTEELDAYPEYKIFGTLPAYGFYCRHIRGLRLENVQASCKTPDQRPAVVCDDVERVFITGHQGSGTQPVIVLRNTRDAVLANSFFSQINHAFLRVEGSSTANIRLSGNNFSSNNRPVEFGDGAKIDAILSDMPAATQGHNP